MNFLPYLKRGAAFLSEEKKTVFLPKVTPNLKLAPQRIEIVPPQALDRKGCHSLCTRGVVLELFT